MSPGFTPVLEVHPKKIGDFEPTNPFLDLEPVRSCWLHVVEEEGQRVAYFEYHDHYHETDTKFCLTLDLEVDTWRALNSILIADGATGKALYVNMLNDLATQIIRQLAAIKSTTPDS